MVHQGMILGPDGNKMSKSKGNTVSPDEYVDKYGSDIFRMYLMFGFDYKNGGPWDDKGIEAMVRYFSRIEKLVESLTENTIKYGENSQLGKDEKELLRVKARTIKAMTQDIQEFQFNTAIARHMELLNQMNDYLRTSDNINEKIFKETLENYLRLLAPLAPHFAEELWMVKMKKESSIHNEDWPKLNEDELNGGTKQVPIQINGKLKDCISVDAEESNEKILELIKQSPKIIQAYEEFEIKKEIYVPGKIYNLVTGAKK